ncbi:MAG: VOC family protein [Alphaproteobacteria bacterium]
MTKFQHPNLSRLSSCLMVADIKKSIDFCTKAFGFEVLETNERDGVLIGAALKLGDVSFLLSVLNSFYMRPLANAGGEAKTPIQTGIRYGSSVYAYCPNVDELYVNAMASGAQSLAEPLDSPWGDRFCQLRDPDGYEWAFATYTNAA